MTNRKVAVVTGGANGIGRATAHAFIREGFNVGVIDADRTAVDDLRHELPDSVLLCRYGDIGYRDDIPPFVAAVFERFGRLDVLVNNAGVRVAGSVDGTDLRDFEHLFAVNCRGMFLMTQAATPYLRKSGGAIINVSSSAGVGLDADAPIYSASKAWINKLTECLALQLGPRAVRVNAVCPGSVRTDFLRSAFNYDEEAMEDSRLANPMRRIASPEEIAEAIVWLASDNARFVNGSIFSIDGGERLAGEPAK